jgi:hypothetical protein
LKVSCVTEVSFALFSSHLPKALLFFFLEFKIWRTHYLPAASPVYTYLKILLCPCTMVTVLPWAAYLVVPKKHPEDRSGQGGGSLGNLSGLTYACWSQ